MQDKVWFLLFSWLNIESVQVELLTMVINLIKHNATTIDEAVLSTLIKIVCSISNESANVTTIEQTLRVLDAVVRKIISEIHPLKVRYGQIPSGCLPVFISALCRAVNIEAFNTLSWSI